MPSTAPLPLWPIFRGAQYLRGSSDEDSVDDLKEADSDIDSESDCDSDCDSDAEIDQIEQQIDRRNRLFKLDEDGYLVWHLVFRSYGKKEWLRSGPFSPRVLYDSSSPTELRQYIQNRSLEDPYPQGLTLKYFYLRTLDRADEAWCFRFLSLIPELRNMVYKELLTFVTCPHCPAVHDPCHPAILRTCKEVYNEAKSILYAENEIHCRFSATGSTNGYSPASFFSSIHGREITGNKRKGLDSLFYGMKQIPEYVRNIQRLHIDVAFRGGGMASARFSLQSCLLNLASFLMDDHCLKKLRVHIYDMADMDEDDVAYTTELDGIAYPLRRLRGLKEVELTGVSDEVKTAIIADMRSETGTFNTTKHMHQLLQEAHGYLRMIKTLDPFRRAMVQMPPQQQTFDLSDNISNIVMELGDFSDMDEEYNAFFDAETELNTRRKMEDLKDCLAKVNLDDLEQRRKEYLDLQRTRAEYLSNAEWISPEGTWKAMKGARRNWEPRLTEDDEW